MNDGMAVCFSGRDDFFRYFSGLTAEECRKIFRPYHQEFVLVSHEAVGICHGLSTLRRHFYLGIISVDSLQTMESPGIPTTRYVEGCNGEYFFRQGGMIPRDLYLVGGEPIQLPLDLQGSWDLVVGNDVVRQWLATQRHTPYLTNDLLRVLARQ
jgi:hypothetical protein